MDEREIEERLARYRPAGPPPALAARVRALAARPRRAPAVLLAAAAVFALATALHWRTTGVYADIARPAVERAEAVRDAEVDALTTALGGGDVARQRAEHIVRWDARREASTDLEAVLADALEEQP